MSQEVRDLYDNNVLTEWQRLETPYSRLEFASTLRLIEDYFPPHGHVCDIGSGPGRYAVELLERGYDVTLLDLSEKLLEFAQAMIQGLGLQARQIVHGDARDLGRLDSEGFDAALLLGPLYHLAVHADRARALQELYRVLKPGGVAIVAYLNAWGIVRTGITDFPDRYHELSFVRALLDECDLGIWHLSTPHTALAEVEAAQLEVLSYAGAEGFAGGMKPLLEKLAADHPKAYENVMRLAVETCRLEQYRDATDHLHIVCRRPRT
jgi:ubiquinone/menaquinone biosynthesis C-methylase UbiE